MNTVTTSTVIFDRGMSDKETFGSAHEDNEKWKRFRKSGINSAEGTFYPDKGVDIPADGDCFFHCISRSRPKLGSVQEIRNRLHGYCVSQKGASFFRKVVKFLADRNASEESILQDLVTPGRWGGTIASVLCFSCFGLRILTFSSLTFRMKLMEDNKKLFQRLNRLKDEEDDDEVTGDEVYLLHHVYGHPLGSVDVQQ